MNLKASSRDDENDEAYPMLHLGQPADGESADRYSLDSEDPIIIKGEDKGSGGSALENGRRKWRHAWRLLALGLFCILLLVLAGFLLAFFFHKPSGSRGPANGSNNPVVNLAELELDTGFTISNVPTTREYVFDVARALAAPDGLEKSMVLVNGQSPGPLIEANIGDVLRIKVNNRMAEESTTIHWHGIEQRNTNWMDGVHRVTQCAIPPGESFTYEFNVTGQRGSFWYHSHLSVQYTDGLYGPLIIHDPDEKVPPVDDDKIVMFGDFFYDEAEKLNELYLGPEHPWSPMMAGMEPPPDNILINGVHVTNCSAPPGANPKSKGATPVTDISLRCASGSLHNTRVKSGDRVRFRLISHSTSTPFWLTVDNHTLEIVEIDGTEVEPIATTRVFVNPGQRYSVLVSANQTAGNYFLRASAATPCFHLPRGGAANLAGLNNEAVAILTYDDIDPKSGVIGLPWDLRSKSNADFGTEPWAMECDDLPYDVAKPVRKEKEYEVGERNYHYFSFERHTVGGHVQTIINETTYKPLQNDATLWNVMEQFSSTQDADSPARNGDFALDQVLITSQDADGGAQIVVNNRAMMMHPFHLHGTVLVQSPFRTTEHRQSFQVIGWGRKDYGDGETTWSLDNPIRRDTITIPGFAHVVLRIRGDNPGVWAIHCHILWHAEEGMTLAIAQRLDELEEQLNRLDTAAAGQPLRRRFCSAGSG
ncbi:hypothetical protein jhhlp_000612 [Lomentospora prolificans]|uniref:Multicopper oxidase n=1 Tax=Lomentospora prolificans TaxID=41688 RepID=A0A2N3NJ14_9PEZI|nr:hypothetical protein jhhlp_000612 [Lomentospora prolificans]